MTLRNSEGFSGRDEEIFSDEQLQPTILSTNSHLSAYATNIMDPSEEQPQDMTMSSSYLPEIPGEFTQGNFARFLGPDSLENLFTTGSEHWVDVISENNRSEMASFFQNFDSLDQYVDILDLDLSQDQLQQQQ